MSHLETAHDSALDSRDPTLASGDVLDRPSDQRWTSTRARHSVSVQSDAQHDSEKVFVKQKNVSKNSISPSRAHLRRCACSPEQRRTMVCLSRTKPRERRASGALRAKFRPGCGWCSAPATTRCFVSGIDMGTVCDTCITRFERVAERTNKNISIVRVGAV